MHLIIVPGGSFVRTGSVCTGAMWFAASCTCVGFFLIIWFFTFDKTAVGVELVTAVGTADKGTVLVEIGANDGGEFDWRFGSIEVQVVVWILRLPTGAVDLTIFIVCITFAALLVTFVSAKVQKYFKMTLLRNMEILFFYNKCSKILFVSSRMYYKWCT